MKKEDSTFGMEMPCPCDYCGDWFDLNDGRSSIYKNIAICRNCYNIEEEKKQLETEKLLVQDEIDDRTNLRENKKRLRQINLRLCEIRDNHNI